MTNLNHHVQGKLLLILKISVALVFLGRGYQNLFWDAPFRTFLWDESLLSSFVENVIGISWHEYVTHPETDYWIENLTRINGFIYLMAFFSTIFINRRNYRFLKLIIYTGSLSLLAMAFLEMKDSFYHSAQFFEYSIQFASPILLLRYIKKGNKRKLLIGLKILIALTFTAHGLYALGYYPVPGHFVDMTIACLSCNESFAISFLYAAGIIDLLISVLLFFPKISRYALIYAAAWGFLTALARVVSPNDMELISIFHEYLYQTIYRLPHSLIPILAYVIIINENSNLNNPSKNPSSWRKKFLSS